MVVVQSAHLRDAFMLKYDFPVFVWQLILISIISNKAKFDNFHSMLMLLTIAILASSSHLFVK